MKPMKSHPYREVHASARFWGETLDPLAVTLALRIPPDHAHRAGEPRLSRSLRGHVLEGSPYGQGMWSCSSQAWVRARKLETHLAWLLDQLEPRAAQVAQLLRAGVKADFFCFSVGSSREPPALSRAVRARAAALGMEILVDHHVESSTEGGGSAPPSGAQRPA